jgi:hypothetical protein
VASIARAVADPTETARHEVLHAPWRLRGRGGIEGAVEQRADRFHGHEGLPLTHRPHLLGPTHDVPVAARAGERADERGGVVA